MKHSESPWHLRPGRIFVDPRAYAALDEWHAVAATLRREDPLPLVEEPGFDPFFAVTRHADVVAIERDHEHFWNTQDCFLQPAAALERAREAGVDLKTLVQLDGEEHRGYRKVTSDGFKPANLRRTLESRMAVLSRRFVDRMLERDGSCDFAADVALYYPLHVIQSLLGVPEEDEPLMLDLTQKFFASEDPDFGGDDAEASRAKAVATFADYFARVVEDRRARPRDDLASTVANGTVDGAPLGPQQQFSYYVIIAAAGHDTTSSSLSGGLEALVRNPDQLRDLQRDPGLIENAVDEMIRWMSPVRHFLRHAQEDVRIAGKTVRQGERVLLSYLSANRDETVFEDPFRFDVRRRNAEDHVAFGLGVHFCLGAHLARMELVAFFRELLPRLEEIELAGEPEYTAATFVGGPKRMPIRYRLRPAGARA